MTPLTCLSREYTQIIMSEHERVLAVQAARWRTASPHEWRWSLEDQARMAMYVLWASQRLEAIEEIAHGKPLLHESEEKR